MFTNRVCDDDDCTFTIVLTVEGCITHSAEQQNLNGGSLYQQYSRQQSLARHVADGGIAVSMKNTPGDQWPVPVDRTLCWCVRSGSGLVTLSACPTLALMPVFWVVRRCRHVRPTQCNVTLGSSDT